MMAWGSFPPCTNRLRIRSPFRVLIVASDSSLSPRSGRFSYLSVYSSSELQRIVSINPHSPTFLISNSLKAAKHGIADSSSTPPISNRILIPFSSAILTENSSVTIRLYAAFSASLSIFIPVTAGYLPPGPVLPGVSIVVANRIITGGCRLCGGLTASLCLSLASWNRFITGFPLFPVWWCVRPLPAGPSGSLRTCIVPPPWLPETKLPGIMQADSPGSVISSGAVPSGSEACTSSHQPSMLSLTVNQTWLYLMNSFPLLVRTPTVSTM